MAQQNEDVVRRALLIGIDFYESDKPKSNPNNRNLSGCVNDVLVVEKFLLDMGLPENNITKLLAPCQNEKLAPYPGSTEPTHSNIVKELEKIRDSGDNMKVDLLYIHYSAHGIRLKSTPSDILGENDRMWMALSTLDTFSSGRYLSGRRLGSLLREIVEEKRTRICLVLDSCFSGGGFRGDEDLGDLPPTFRPRFVEMDEAVFDALEHTNELDEEPAIEPSGSRNAKYARSNWMITPVGCTVVAACGTNQAAGEEMFGDKTYGVLTYWMLEVLRDTAAHVNPIRPSHMPSYARLRYEVQKRIQAPSGNNKQQKRQTPAIRGQASFLFFGNDIAVERPYCEVLDVGKPWLKGGVCINVGECQGVAVGAVYSIQSTDLVTIRIVHVNDFYSVGSLVGTAAKPEIGDIGFLQTWALPEARYVRLDIDDDDIRRKIGPGIEETHKLSCENVADEQTHFQVSVNSRGIYEVHKFLDSGRTTRRLHRVPTVSRDEPDAMRKVAYIIRQITRYQAIERILRLSPPTSHLKRNDFTYGCWEAGQQQKLRQDENGVYIATEGVHFEFTLTYHGTSTQSVWVALFELNADWGIKKTYPRDGISADQIRGETSLDLTVAMEIPAKCVSDDSSEALDQFIIFACPDDDRSAPSWDEISLSPFPSESSWDLDYFSSAFTQGHTVRGSKMVQKLTRQPPRRAWVALGFQVCTIPAI